MPVVLTQQEIKKRLIRLRNLERLHTQALKQNDKLRRDKRELKERVKTLEDTVATQQSLIEALTLQVEELKRMVFGRRRTKEKPNEESGGGEDDDKNTPRKNADRTRDSYHRPVPKDEEVTTEEHHGLDVCPDCRTSLLRTETRVFYEEDIVLPTEEKPLKTVTKHTVERGWCPSCSKWVSAYSLPPTIVTIGKNAKIYVCYLFILLRLSLEQIRTLFRTTYRFEISDGEIIHILECEASILRPEYEALKDRIRAQKGVHYDETSWKVQNREQRKPCLDHDRYRDARGGV